MSDDELQDGEERHSDDTPLNISEEDLGDEVAVVEDGEIPIELAEDGVLVGSDDEDEEELDYESHDDVDPF